MAGAVMAVKAGGAAAKTEPHIITKMDGEGICRCEWTDTEGNIMAFMEERRVAA